MKIILTLDTFKLDYSRLVVRHYGNDKEIFAAAEKHIDQFYSHIKRDCTKWLNNRKSPTAVESLK